ncbi:MAG: ABC transporter substrate-binding protein [Bacilli bacterium]|nr:ABC transporter substrate-binding protein [Bacilli bacterium]
MKYVRILFLVILLCVVSSCTRNKNELIMVTEAGFSPYEFYQNKKIVGVDIEIAKEIAKTLNKKLIVKDVAFDSLMNEIKSGKADFAAAGLSITKERQKQVDFTIEYAVSKQVVVVKKGSLLRSIKDLDGKDISVQLGTVADAYAQKNYKKATIRTHKKYLTAAEDVKSEKADCIIMDILPAKQLVEQNKELEILEGVLFTDKYGMAVKKGNKELLEKMNAVLKKLMSENKIEEYTVKYSNE